MHIRIIENILETIKMNYLISSRDNNNFVINTIIIVIITIIGNAISNNYIEFSNIYEWIYNFNKIFRKKNTFYLEGKRSLKNSDYCTRTDTLFSDRFIAFWHFINKNSMINSDIYSFKEYAESSNLYDEYGEAKHSKRNTYNRYFKTNKDIFVVNQRRPFIIKKDLYCKVDISIERNDDKKCTVLETIYIQLYSYKLSNQDILDYLDRIDLEYKKELDNIRQNKKFIYTLIGNKTNNNDYDDPKPVWEECEFNSTRTFNNMFFDQKKYLLDKLNFFENNKNWYEYEGHPYTFGIGLHGPPGTGKTSIIKCIANKLNRHIIVLPLSKIKTQSEFNEYFFENRYSRYNIHNIDFNNKIIVFEDIDCMSNIVKQRVINDNNIESSNENIDINITDEKNDDTIDKNTIIQNKLLNKIAKKIDDEHDENMIINFNKDKNDKITLSYILNIIDGIRETPGRILIITSNNYNSLDSALIRPGRIDITLEMKNASIDVIKEMYNHYYKDIIPDDIAENLIDYKISHAKIVNLRLEYSNGEDFLKALMKEFKK